MGINRGYYKFILVIIFSVSCKPSQELIRSEKNICLKGSLIAYQGFPNYLFIDFYGYDSIKLFFDEQVLQFEDDHFLLNIDLDYSDLGLNKIDCYEYINDDSLKIESLYIEINQAEMRAQIGNLPSNDSTMLSHFKVQKGIMAEIYLPSNSPCDVKKYKYQVIRNDEIVFSQLVVGTPAFTEELKNYMDSLKVGDMILVSDIQIRCAAPRIEYLFPLVYYLK